MRTGSPAQPGKSSEPRLLLSFDVPKSPRRIITDGPEKQLLYFLQRVNTETLETAYKNKRGGSCPSGMKSMPQLRFSIRWDVREVLPGGWSGTALFRPACVPAWCSHGDFINGWTKDSADKMLDTSREKFKFSAVNGALGEDASGPKCKASDADPSKGMSDCAESVAAMGKRDVLTWGWSSKSRMVRN